MDKISTFTLAELRARREVAAAEFAACGKIVVSGCVSPALVAAVTDAMRQIFESRESIPHACLRSVGDGDGYTPPGIEGVRGYPPDPVRHFWDVSGYGGKIPDDARDIVMRLRESVVDIGAMIASGLDAIFDTNFTGGTRGGNHHLRIAHYLHERCDGEVIFPAHVDWDLLTIHLGGSGPDMQYLDGDMWRNADLPAGDVLVFPGSLMRAMDDRLPRALRHRVVGITPGRISLIGWLSMCGDVALPGGETVTERDVRLMRQIRHEKKERP